MKRKRIKKKIGRKDGEEETKGKESEERYVLEDGKGRRRKKKKWGKNRRMKVGR